MSEWVTLVDVDSVPRAHLLIAHLQSENITARIEHEHMNSLMPELGRAQRTVRIKVPWQDARRAYELMEAYRTEDGDRLFL